MSRLLRTKYNTKVSYKNSIQKNSRDSAFQIIYSYDELSMTQHSSLSRIKWILALRFLLWKITIYSSLSIPLWSYKFTKRLFLFSQMTFIFLKVIVEDPCQNQAIYSLLIRSPLHWLFFNIPQLNKYPITLFS